MTLRLRILLVLYGVLNATAYTFLLPLWEGFDEAFHYGYVQSLSTSLKFPVVDRTMLSKEIWHALQLAPVSHFIQPSTGAPVSFRDYFELSPNERMRRRQQLDSLPAAEKYLPGTEKSNYEVTQSPLPYILMAPVDRLLSGFPLTARVLWLRLLCSVAAVLLLWHATMLLARELSVPDVYVAALMFCVFSSQMLYATICHVCNDWLAVPLFCYLTWAAIRIRQSGSVRHCLTLGVVFSAALLTKAYFLFLAPLPIAVVGWGLWRGRTRPTAAAAAAVPVLLLAGPWYVRNIVLYHSLGGTQQNSGIGLKQLAEAALIFPWRKSLLFLAHSSLWTGNNSFTAFSSTTLDLVLLLLAAGLGLYLLRRPRGAPERITIAAAGMLCAGLFYIGLAFFVGSKGLIFAAMPWYSQLLLAPVLLLAFLGMSRAPRWGGPIARLTVLAWGYVLAATYLAKLIPMYGGYPGERARLPDLWAWYRNNGVQRDAILQTLCLVKPSLLWGMTSAAMLLGGVLCVRLASAGYTNRPRCVQSPNAGFETKKISSPSTRL